MDVAGADQLAAGLLLLRGIFGVFLFCHGYNKAFRGNGLTGTASWFRSIGMRWPLWQARLAAFTEMGAGLMFAAGLLTPLAAAGMVGLMLVAIVTVHWRIGFFIFRKGEGWEYCGSILAVAVAVSTIGPGRWSLDAALDLTYEGWIGAITALVLGVGAAIGQLAVSYRPEKEVAAS